MRARTLIFLVLAIGTAGLAAMFVRGVMRAQQAAIQHQAEPPPPVAATEVLVAKNPIPAGTFIKPEDLRWQAWPEGTLAAGYVTKAKGSMEEFTGAVVKVGFSVGEPVTDVRVAKPGDRGFLAAVLTPGNRAVAIAVNAITGVSGFVLPGDRVDVLLTHGFNSKGANSRNITVTETALQDIRVIAVDQNTADNAKEAVLAKTVTFEATPKEAETLNLVASMGKVSLALRSLALADGAPAKKLPFKPTVTVDHEVSAMLGAGPSNTATVQVVRGNKKAQMEGGRSGSGGRPAEAPEQEEEEPSDVPVAVAPPANADTSIAGQMP
jgi:pilus assembly protein CpaB